MDNQDIFKQKSVSLWLKDGLESDIPTLREDLDCDVLIVGAGITGITTAYRLHEEGRRVVLIDKQEPLHLATGNTTAKFTFQHDLIYADLIKNEGQEKAGLYYQAQKEGLDYARALIQRHGIDCDFKQTSAIVYAQDDKSHEDLLKEKSAYEKLAIPHEFIDELPMGIKGKGGLQVPGQFALNPVKYLDFLLSYLLAQGVLIYKDTEASSVEKEEDGFIKVETAKRQTIRCKDLVIATAWPFYDGKGLYFTRLAASRSYLMAFPVTDAKDEEFMMISCGPSTYSLRYSDTDGVKYLLVGGQGHKVGQADSEMRSYQELLYFAKVHFGAGQPAFRWSAQDYKTVDTIPYIGQLTSKHEHIYTATGFNKWGMSSGSFAALLMADLILGRASKYEELFRPARGEVKENLGSFLKSNLDVAREFIKGKVAQDEISLDDIQNDQGGIIKLHGQRVAAYRDKEGSLYLSDSTCTHMGCELEYNDAERSFDCPCHGSRFNYDGKVIEGPAMRDLKKVDA